MECNVSDTVVAATLAFLDEKLDESGGLVPSRDMMTSFDGPGTTRCDVSLKRELNSGSEVHQIF